ncbi:MAG: hypothetical protein AAGH64_08530 [Planctomycetota bacterium]
MSITMSNGRPTRPLPPNSAILTAFCGDSIAQGFESKAAQVRQWPTGYSVGSNVIPRTFMWNKHTVAFPGTRFTASDDGTGLTPLEANQGLNSGGDDIGLEWGVGLTQSKLFEGTGAANDPVHVFAKWAGSGAVINDDPANNLVCLNPLTTAGGGYDAFVPNNVVPAITFLKANYDHVYLQALIFVSFAGDASSSGQGSFVANMENLYAANAKVFIDAFKEAVGAPSLSTLLVKSPLVGDDTDLNRLPAVRAQQDEMFATQTVQGIVDISEFERRPTASDLTHFNGQGCLDAGIKVGGALFDMPHALIEV